jgi:3-keto-disaccharide hydrolase
MRSLVTVLICLSLSFSSTAQQAPAHHTGGGFTQPDPIDFNDHEGWTQIFDGKSLKGWDGTPDVWHVEDGSLVGESSPEHPSGTTNIIWRGGEPANFALKVEMKLEGKGANGGIQYRSQMLPIDKKYGQWNMRGYQADFDYANQYTGQLYEQSSPRGIVAWRGQMVETDPGKPHRLLASLGDPDLLKSYIKIGEWNQYEVIADGHTLIHIINGHVMAVLVDNDPAFSQSKGLIAFEIEGGGVLKVSHRNVWLKQLP